MIKQKELVPKRRFEGFNEEWEVSTLGEVASVVGGGTPSTSVKEYWDGEINWYSPIEIGNEIYVNKSQRKISKLGFENSSANVLPAGTILFTSRAGIGKTAILQKEATTNQGFQSIVPIKNKLDTYFVYSRSNELKGFGEKNASGSTFLEITGKQMEKMNINLPDLQEQQKIGKFFKHLDEMITLQQRKIDKTKALKSAYLAEMFPAEGESVPKRRFVGFTDEWKEQNLEEVIDGLYNGQTPSRSNIKYWNGNIKWLTSGELNKGVVTDTIEKITETGKSAANLKIVPKGIFVMAITGLEAAGTRGNCAILGINTALNQSCMAVYPNRDLLDSQFLFQWYSKIGEKYGLKYTQGTKQQSYNAVLIKRLKIVLPSKLEQQKIGAFFKQLDNKITNQQQKLDKLKATKQAYLHEMFV